MKKRKPFQDITLTQEVWDMAQELRRFIDLIDSAGPAELNIMRTICRDSSESNTLTPYRQMLWRRTYNLLEKIR